MYGKYWSILVVVAGKRTINAFEVLKVQLKRKKANKISQIK
jgi:hypothetical protein